MHLKCEKCRADQEIAEPSDDGWQYDLTEVYQFNDDGSRSVASRSGVRRIFWRCANVVPTKDNPNALCGADNTVEEAWTDASSNTGGKG